MSQNAQEPAKPEKPSTWRRRLKTAWTAFFAVLTLTLCVLWVRSYWNYDHVRGPISSRGTLSSVSIHGRTITRLLNQPVDWTPSWDVGSTSDSDWRMGWEEVKPRTAPILPYASITPTGVTEIVFPHWFAALLVAAFAALPWLPFRFSLLTMLIVTTLVAVVLGMIVWAARG